MAAVVAAVLMSLQHFLAVLVVHRLAVMVEHLRVKMELQPQQQTHSHQRMLRQQARMMWAMPVMASRKAACFCSEMAP